MKGRGPTMRRRLVLSGTPKAPPDGVVHTGRPEHWHTGVPMSLGRDGDGRQLIYWSAGQKRCSICGGGSSYQEWRRHMRSFTLRDGHFATGRVVRAGLRCPMVSDRTLVSM